MSSANIPEAEFTGCGSCSLCCKVIGVAAEPEANFEFKPEGIYCKHCKPGSLPGGCRIYSDRPKDCREFQCVWLQTQHLGLRTFKPSMAYRLKPSQSKVVLSPQYEQFGMLFAIVDPDYPHAARRDPMATFLRKIVDSENMIVVIHVGPKKYVMTKGRPPIRLSTRPCLIPRLRSDNTDIKQPQAIQLSPEGHVQAAYDETPNQAPEAA